MTTQKLVRNFRAQFTLANVNQLVSITGDSRQEIEDSIRYLMPTARLKFDAGQGENTTHLWDQGTGNFLGHIAEYDVPESMSVESTITSRKAAQKAA